LEAGVLGGAVTAAVCALAHFGLSAYSPRYTATSFRLKVMVSSMAVVAIFAVQSERALVRKSREHMGIE
jgi:hypothetical protein